MSDALSWSSNWAWALPLIVLTLILQVVGLALINIRMVRLMTHRAARHPVARIAGHTVGGCLPHAWGVAGWTHGPAVLIECDYQLRSHRPHARTPLAPHGSARSSRWNAALWAYHGLLVRPPASGVAGGAATTGRVGEAATLEFRRVVEMAEGSRSRTYQGAAGAPSWV